MTTLYVDGSTLRKGKSFYDGYAAVLLKGDDHLEQSSGRQMPMSHTQSHEHYAFLHGLEFALQHGVHLGDLRVVCDDQTFGYANTWLHADNFSGKKDLVVRAVENMVFATSEQKSLLLNFLETGFVHKVKGHRQEVYQERVDYLASTQRKLAMGEECDLLAYDQWLNKGFKVFDNTRDSLTTVYPPFVNVEMSTQ